MMTDQTISNFSGDISNQKEHLVLFISDYFFFPPKKRKPKGCKSTLVFMVKWYGKFIANANISPENDPAHNHQQ